MFVVFVNWVYVTFIHVASMFITCHVRNLLPEFNIVEKSTIAHQYIKLGTCIYQSSCQSTMLNNGFDHQCNLHNMYFKNGILMTMK